MWINIFTNNTYKKYLLLTDEDICAAMDCYNWSLASSDDILLADGYELFSANYHSYKGATQAMERYFPDFTKVNYEVIPLSLREASTFILENHRHHLPPQGCKFAIGATAGVPGHLIGVAIAGRPVSRYRDDGNTLEITRLCVKPGFRNLCSLLYSRIAHIACFMGYKILISYTTEEESGHSLMAAGFRMVGTSKGGSWSCHNRSRDDKHPICPKKVWERIL